MKLLVILFTIKLDGQNNVFKHIKKKHGQEIIRIVKSFENLKTKYVKVAADIRLIQSCKIGNIIPTSTKVKFVFENGDYKLQLRIARIVTETELQNKYREKSKLKKEIENT